VTDGSSIRPVCVPFSFRRGTVPEEMHVDLPTQLSNFWQRKPKIPSIRPPYVKAGKPMGRAKEATIAFMPMAKMIFDRRIG